MGSKGVDFEYRIFEVIYNKYLVWFVYNIYIK